MIRIAIQAKGRLNEKSIALLKDLGIKVEDGKRQLLSKSSNFPLEVLYLRDDDIPQVVAAGIADIGIVGLNEVEEKQENIEICHNLGFGKCRLALAIPKSEQYSGLDYFNGKRIATSYPAILTKYFAENKINAEILQINGSVEIAPAVSMADAIFDIVSSGTTLVSNGLVEVANVLNCEAVLIKSKQLDAMQQQLLNQLLFRIKAVENSQGKKYILVNIPNEKINDAINILPGMKSPTLLPLAKKDWSSLHAVVNESELWDKIELLKSIGAEDILVLTLEKMIL